MFATRALRKGAQHAERTPMIKFIGPRSTPSSIDHSPHPHPESPAGKLPESFTTGYGSGNDPNAGSSHASFSSYRDAVQQHGPLRKSFRATDGIGRITGADLGAVEPPKGVYFAVSELPARFRPRPLDAAEIEAVESGGAV